jgi:hypothetical protein
MKTKPNNITGIMRLLAIPALTALLAVSAEAAVIIGSTTAPGGLAPNLAASAAGATITSYYTPSFSGFAEPAYANDGLNTTQWSTQGGALNAFMTISLAGPSTITHIGYMSRGAANGSPGQEDVVNSFRITFSDTSSQDFQCFSDATALDFQWYTLPTPVVTTSIHFKVLTAGYDDGGFINNTGAKEIQAYGVAVPEPSTFALLGAGMGLLFLARRRARK